MVIVFVVWLVDIVVETFDGRSQRVMEVTLAMGGCLCGAPIVQVGVTGHIVGSSH